MNPEQVRMRKRRTPEEVEQLVAEFLSSGMREMEFCRSRGLSRDTLNRHLKKQGKKQDQERPASRLVRVKMGSGKKGRARAETGAGLAVVLAGGRRIEVGMGFDALTLERVVEVLEGR
jgi:hypothetical protein